MWQQFDRILRQAAGTIADHIADFLPGALAALFVILLTVVAAVVVRIVVARLLSGVDVGRQADRFGLSGMFAPGTGATFAQTVARTAYWTIVLLGLLVSLTALNATIPSRLAIAIFEYIPHLAAALLILLVGTLAARLLSRSALIGAVNMQMQSARLVSLLVKWLVLLVTVAMALDHLGIGRSVLLLAFGILFGGIVLAISLAVGLGARDLVGRALERLLQAPPRRDDTVDHV